MKRSTLIKVVATGAFLLCALTGYADRLRGGITFEYGSSSSWFGLASAPFFSVPYQNNSSSDGVLSGSLEYLVVRGWALEVGVAFKGSFALSGWNLGSPGVTDTLGYYYYPDDVHISADWWALAALVTAHVHVGPFATLDGAVGYGPFGYMNVTYWDDAGVVTGPVTQGSGVFPKNAWSVDWSAGLSFWFFGLLSLSLDVGMMGPDFVSGIGVNFRI